MRFCQFHALDGFSGILYLTCLLFFINLFAPMLTIRLSRVGKTKQPSYRLIVSEKTKDPWGDSLEMLGTYHPLANPPVIAFKNDRITYWISKGAQMSDTVRNLLIDQKVVTGEKRKKVSLSTRRKEKLAKKQAA
jgi:small subunit ribosomal protein S16